MLSRLRRGLLSSVSALGGFSPAALFAASEPGAWYDPSDLSTLFQDAAGTTPVTAAGQVVGLALDKRLGLVPGANVLPTLDFTNAVAWSPVAGGTLTRDSASSFTTTASGGLRRPSTLSVSSWYRITFNYTATAGLGVRNALSNANVVGTDVSAGSGVFSAFFNAIDTNLYFRLAAAGSLSVSNIVIRELPGNHASQTTTASKPILQQDANGRYYLLFDGVDDFLVTGSINFTATDKMTVLAGVRKLSDATIGMVAELSPNVNTNNGTFWLAAPVIAGTANFGFSSKGTIVQGKSQAGFSAPVSAVLAGQGDIAGSSVNLRVNGNDAGALSASQGTGTYGNFALYIGRRNGASAPFNGHIYGLIVRGATTDAATIAQTEAWLNQRTGAY